MNAAPGPDTTIGQSVASAPEGMPTDRRHPLGRLAARLTAAARSLRAKRSWPAALGGGVLLYAAFPPIGLWWLAPAGPALLALAVRGRRKRAAFACGTLFGLAFFGPLLVWLANLTPAAWLGLTAAESVLLGLLALPLPRLLSMRGWPVFFAAWWVATEAVRGRAPLGGFPWGRLAFSQADAPYAVWAAVGGSPLLSFATALLGSLAAWLVAVGRSRGYRRVAPVGAAMAAIIAVPPLLSLTPRTEGAAVVAVVQGNVPRTRSLEEQARVVDVAENHARETAELAAAVRRGELPRPDLVLWPENSLDSDPNRDPELRSLVSGAAAALDRPLLIGAILRDDQGRTFNAGQVWLPGIGPTQSYAKRQLVPFGEYIPLRGLLGGLGELQLIPRDFTPGSAQAPLTAGPARIGDVICYEVGYDALVRDAVRGGANLLVVQTNNATYERGLRAGQSTQQVAMARVRAIEYGRSVAVASTTGVSAVIGPDGRVAASAGTWRSAHLVRRVPLISGSTPAARLGVLPEASLTALAIAGVGWSFLRRRRAQPEFRAVSTGR
ncbi:apolipoprotein N-acyltransferase [Kitasatospora sp. NPDC098652]|uniref:apolipoprotein N-acyltransferase n=1 Tax=Kitasatospora sp. NPDC098652 TaxID=3364095 RepID=UPI003825140E